LTRARFENVIQTFLNDYTATLTSALKEVNEDNRKIDEIVLAGATLKIPKIQSLISSLIPDTKLNTKFAPEEVVAIGCARQSLFIHPDHEDFENTEEIYIIPNPIYIWHKYNKDTAAVYENGIDEKSKVIDDTKKIILCEKGTTVPCVFRIFVDAITADDATLENNSVTFCLQYGDCINDVSVEDLKLKDNKFHLEVSIELNDEHSKNPIINLKSVNETDQQEAKE